MQVDLADSQSTTVEVAYDPGGRLQALNWTQRRSLRPDLPGWSPVEVAGYWATSASISQRYRWWAGAVMASRSATATTSASGRWRSSATW
jgi:hypothetical protein